MSCSMCSSVEGASRNTWKWCKKVDMKEAGFSRVSGKPLADWNRTNTPSNSKHHSTLHFFAVWPEDVGSCHMFFHMFLHRVGDILEFKRDLNEVKRSCAELSKNVPGIAPGAPGILSYRVPDVDRRVRCHTHNVPAIRDKGNGLSGTNKA